MSEVNPGELFVNNDSNTLYRVKTEQKANEKTTGASRKSFKRVGREINTNHYEKIFLFLMFASLWLFATAQTEPGIDQSTYSYSLPTDSSFIKTTSKKLQKILYEIANVEPRSFIMPDDSIVIYQNEIDEFYLHLEACRNPKFNLHEQEENIIRVIQHYALREIAATGTMSSSDAGAVSGVFSEVELVF